MECCIDTLRGGAQKTHLVDGRVTHGVLLKIFTHEPIGTQVVRAAQLDLRLGAAA